MVEAREYLAAAHDAKDRSATANAIRRGICPSLDFAATIAAIEAAFAASSRRTEGDLERAAKALMAEHKAIWPGSWPAMPEAKRQARAVLEAVGIRIGDDHG